MKYRLTIFFIITLLNSCSSDEKVYKKIYDYSYSTSEIELLNKINNYRESKGLNKLDTINHVSYMSSLHNKYMIEKNKISHDFFQNRSDEIITLFKASNVGENIAYNYNSNQSVLSAWINSIGHKANLEGDYTHFGLAISIDSLSGKKYYTNIFIKIKK